MVKHLAIIMDGNGRWAQERGYARAWGHRQGARQVDEMVEHCVNKGIEYLTLYAFSTENWNRPPAEVGMLMRLVVRYLRKSEAKLIRNRVALVAQGTLDRLPGFVKKEVERVAASTALPGAKMKLNISLSYGGRQEMVDCARRLAAQVVNQEISLDQIDEKAISRNLYQPDFPDPDLLIRTGGEFRLSNFLLWQVAYSEIYVTDTLWPDFGLAELERALEVFSRRERRFGKTSAQVRPLLLEGAL